MPMLHKVIDPETAHMMAVKSIKYHFQPFFDKSSKESTFSVSNKYLSIDCMGIHFDNVIGLAAGFDKDGESVNNIFRTGLGFAEIGSVTPLPQPGNPKPRVFRLETILALAVSLLCPRAHSTPSPTRTQILAEKPSH